MPHGSLQLEPELPLVLWSLLQAACPVLFWGWGPRDRQRVTAPLHEQSENRARWYKRWLVSVPEG